MSSPSKDGFHAPRVVSLHDRREEDRLSGRHHGGRSADGVLGSGCHRGVSRRCREDNIEELLAAGDHAFLPDGRCRRGRCGGRLALLQPLPKLVTVQYPDPGGPVLVGTLYHLIVAAAGTPRAIVDKLNAALNTALTTDDVKRRLSIEGAEALPVSPDAHAADIAAEETKWSEIIRKSGMKAE